MLEAPPATLPTIEPAIAPTPVWFTNPLAPLDIALPLSIDSDVCILPSSSMDTEISKVELPLALNCALEFF